MKKNVRRACSLFLAACLAVPAALLTVNPAPVKAEETTADEASTKDDDTIVLRVSNWEEYIDLGDWDEEETIDLESGDIIGENSMIEDFEAWYEETYGRKVKVEYSTFGTNEDLYNMLTLGDV